MAGTTTRWRAINRRSTRRRRQACRKGGPKVVPDTMLVAYPNNIESGRELLDAPPDQVAAVILEPGGGSNGIIPTNVAFLKELRALTAERGVVLIFDEVITGFRYSPGGAQQIYGA